MCRKAYLTIFTNTLPTFKGTRGVRIIENPYIEHLESIFTGVPFLTTKQILEGLRKRFPETPEWALSSAVGKLKRDGVIRKIDGKLFDYGNKRCFNPYIANEIADLFQSAQRKLLESRRLSVSYTLWLSEFYAERPLPQIIVIETIQNTERELIYFLRKAHPGVFFSSNIANIHKRLREGVKCCFAKAAMGNGALKSVSNVQIPSLEKLLVDLADNYRWLYNLEYDEVKNIFYRALASYEVNYGVLRRYANSLDRGIEVKNLLMVLKRVTSVEVNNPSK